MAKPSKTPLIQEFIAANNGKIYSTKEMCTEIGVSLPTLLAFIKNNPESFAQQAYGVYKIEVNAQATY
jgi:hypothetical protein